MKRKVNMTKFVILGEELVKREVIGKRVARVILPKSWSGFSVLIVKAGKIEEVRKKERNEKNQHGRRRDMGKKGKNAAGV